MRIANWGFLGLALVGFCGMPLSAAAEVGMFGYSNASVVPEEGDPLHDYHEFLLSTIAPEDLPVFRDAAASVQQSGDSLANGYAAAGLGQLKARSLAVYPLDNTLGFASSESLVVTQETATASSTTGNPGDPITVDLSLTVTGTVSNPASYEDDLYDASATAVLVAGDLSNVSLAELLLALSDGTLPPSSDYSLLSYNSHTSPGSVVTGSFSTTVGTTFDLFYALLTNAVVTGTSPARTASADYSNTLTFSLMPAEPGAIITTFGGQEFTAAVPEPQTWLLLGAGLLVLTAWSVRRRTA